MSAPRFHNLQHPVVRRFDPDVFRATFAPDCMAHACAVRATAEDADPHGPQLDACCRYGCNVEQHEREAILARGHLIAPLLRPELRDRSRWFDETDPEPSESGAGWVVRTGLQDRSREHGLCVFLGHDGRGCALHRAALENGFAPEEVKPAVCRLYPLELHEGALAIADDFPWYSCGQYRGGPSVYRVMRQELERMFGAELVAELDVLEGRLGPRH